MNSASPLPTALFFFFISLNIFRFICCISFRLRSNDDKLNTRKQAHLFVCAHSHFVSLALWLFVARCVQFLFFSLAFLSVLLRIVRVLHDVHECVPLSQALVVLLRLFYFVFFASAWRIELVLAIWRLLRFIACFTSSFFFAFNFFFFQIRTISVLTIATNGRIMVTTARCTCSRCFNFEFVQRRKKNQLRIIVFDYFVNRWMYFFFVFCFVNDLPFEFFGISNRNKKW